MSRRTYTYNAYESNLSGALGTGVTSVNVDSATGLTDPCYLIIDPDVPAKREWIRVGNITGSTLSSITRNLTGSVGDIDHDAGAVVRAVMMHQHLDDIFLDIGDLEAADTAHAGSSGDPHAAAGYAKTSEVAADYLALAGGTLTGFLSLHADPDAALKAATKQYVDAAETAANAYSDGLDHDHATPIAAHDVLAAAHGAKDNANPHNHDRYTDTEAAAKVAADNLYLQHGGDAMTGPLDMGNQRLHSPLDPTVGTDVGDRDYNDGRYMAAGAAPNAHIISSHSDTTATGANLNTLTGGGTTTLHNHETQALHPATAGDASEPRIIRSASIPGASVGANGSLWVQY